MRYLKYFENQTDFIEVYEGEGYDEPWLSLTISNQQVNFDKREQDDPEHMPLTFDIIGRGQFGVYYDGPSNDYAFDLEYSLNGGEWTTISPRKNQPALITVSAGDRLQFRADTESCGWGLTSSLHYFTFFRSDVAHTVKGNVMSLLYDADFDGETELRTTTGWTFAHLFDQDTGLVDASDLILPSRLVSNHCYELMFNGCTNLVRAPKVIPVTDYINNDGSSHSVQTGAGYGAFREMFLNCTSLTAGTAVNSTMVPNVGFYSTYKNCTSLVRTPQLPAINLGPGCYSSMFYGCTSLTEMPQLPATILSEGCYREMFHGCTALALVHGLSATTIRNYSYSSMFEGCTSLVTPPVLYGVTIGVDSYRNMFKNCESLETAPVLNAMTLGSNSYYGMFHGCTSLTEPPQLPATSLARGCYHEMFLYCTSLEEAPALPATTLASDCYANMFQYCDSLVEAPVLPAETLVAGCYDHMFWGCSNLNYIKCLATDISASACTSYWVSGVAISGIFVKDPDNDDWTLGVHGIPVTWVPIGDGISISESSISYSQDGGTETITVSCSGNWTASTLANWLTVSPSTGSIGEVNVTITASATSEDREATITFTDGENVVTLTVTQESEPHYENRYLTFNIISGGTIAWVAAGSGYERVIEYSINNGDWVSITASSPGSIINVSDGDVVRFKGNNNSYAGSNTNYDGFSGGTASYNVEGNIMSLVYGDNFIGNSGLNGTYNFCSMFKQSNVISAENLVLPADTLTECCYRALFANSPSLVVAPALPATTLATGCYRYMFQDCSITTAPDLLAPILVTDCCDGMFHGCTNLNYIRCLATDISAISATTGWTQNVANTGLFIKKADVEWERGNNGIPTKWTVGEEGVKKPNISCDGLYITITPQTTGADTYYRLNQSGTYSQYSSPVEISADTIVEAYCTYSGDTSLITSAVCIYDDGIEEPVIYCDGEYISISCDTGGATIYYKLDHAATYSQYEHAIAITADTFVEAYSEIDGRQSEVVSANCTYDDSLKAPQIECDGVEVTITCVSTGADIYYRLDQEGTFDLYESAITITADTFVEAYSVRDTETSTTVSANCIYNPEHDYSQDYLTFRVLSSGVIPWNQINDGGTGTTARSIQYSINDGAWVSITAASSTKINVVAGDVVRFKGTNNKYCDGNNKSYNGFDAYNVSNAATYNVEGNAMSLLYGDNFADKDALPDGSTFTLNSLFRRANVVSAENLSLPATACTASCYRGMFSKSPTLVVAPTILPAAVLADSCYKYMFEDCSGIQSAPELPADTMVTSCYEAMFTACTNLNYIKCMAVSGFTASKCKQNWVIGVAASGTFVKNSNVTTSKWGSGNSGIPTGWLVYDDVAISVPVITCDVNNNVTITCDTAGATIYYKTGQTRAAEYTVYVSAFTIEEDTVVEAYSELNGEVSRTVTQTCEYISDDPYEYSNRSLSKWSYNGNEITTPYSVNAIDGHSASYAKGTFNFEAGFALKEAEPTYLWFQHADQSATIYIDNVQVEKHWGGYSAFFVDISNFVHSGHNAVKVAVKNNEGNNLAPAAGDFNFNATLGNVKLFTSPYLPAMNYGYDGFHVTSDVATSSATIYVKTTIPTGAVVTCEIDDGTYHYGTSANSTGDEMIFSATVANPHLWNGTLDPHLYNITMEIYHDGDLYHRYVRPYGLRFYEYVINMTSGDGTYTGFLLNGQPYLLRGCCMHDDIADKANALNDADYTQTFAIVQELGTNFLRLAHYPHPKETYDWCDRLGIVVQTEGPCVNKMQSTMPTDYYDHLNTQYDDMVNQHYNHPCILFWGLSNETTTDDKSFAHDKINGYISRIKALDSERMVGYVMAQSASDPSGYYNDPNADWFGCNMYEGWYTNKTSNDPSSAINTRIRNLITNKSKAMAYSEYGCGGTQRCHSDDFMNTTTRGNYERHDIEYMMWLHEGHIAAIKNYPQLLFTAQWQLFDIAVANRNEGYTVCLDGVNTSTDDNLRRLNNKGLVERDHITKKDPFYLYKAWWNTTDNFVHICGKEYTKTTDRVIKCYTNDGNSLSLYVNNSFIETVTVTDNIATFTARNFSSGDVVRVEGNNNYDTFTFDE